MKTTVQILEGALGYLRTNGWCQRPCDGERRCVVMAIDAVQVGEDDWRAGVRARRIIRTLVGKGLPFSISEWNDAPTTTFADVEAALTAAIQIAQEQESPVRVQA